MESGVAISLFLGSGATSTLIVRNAVRWRAVSVPAGFSAARAAAWPRPARFPGGQAVRRLTAGCTPERQEDLLFLDYAQSWHDASPDAGTYGDGYDVLLLNMTRACLKTMPQACLDRFSIDQCLLMYTHDMLEGGGATAGSGAAVPWDEVDGGGGGGGAAPAAAPRGPMVPAAAAAVGTAAFALAGAAAAWALWRSNRRRRRGTGQAQDKESAPTAPSVARDGTALSPKRREGPLESMKPRAQGWEVAWFLAAPEHQGRSSPRDRIEIGAELGRGSFGRVYRAVWQGRDAAVKVVRHGRARPGPEEGAALVLGFNHPNVLAVHHVVRWRNAKMGPETDAGDSSDHSSVPSPTAGACALDLRGVHSQLLAASAAGGAEDGGGPAQPCASEEEWVVRLGTAGSADSDRAFGSTAGSSCSGRGPECLTSEELLRMLQLDGARPSQNGGGASNGGGNGRNGAAHSGHVAVGPFEPPSERMPLFTIRSSACGTDGIGDSAGVLSGPELTETWLITEYCSMGDLERAAASGLLRLPDGRPNEGMILSLLRDVTAGLVYLHGRNFVHADLKASNVLLASDPAAPFGVTARLCDFGLSRRLAAGQTHASTRTVGTVTHMPPELLLTGRLSRRGDIYALGALIYELWTGEAPFAGLSFGEVLAQVIMQARPPVPHGMPPVLALLMRACWAHDAGQRPDARQCLCAIDARRASLAARTAAVAAAAAAAAGHGAAAEGGAGDGGGGGGAAAPRAVAR